LHTLDHENQSETQATPGTAQAMGMATMSTYYQYKMRIRKEEIISFSYDSQ
jgi:hypothetical protein